MRSSPGRRRAAGRLVVGLLRPAGDRHRVGLVGEQVAHEQPPAQGHLRQVRGERRRVEHQAQVDRAGGDHRHRGRCAVGQRVGRRQLRGAGEHDRRQPDRHAAAEARRDRGGPGHQAERDHADEHRRHRPGPGRQLGAGGRGGHRCIMPWHPPPATRVCAGRVVRCARMLAAAPRRSPCCAAGCTWCASSSPSRRGSPSSRWPSRRGAGGRARLRRRRSSPCSG